jgi:hypothetical protein
VSPLDFDPEYDADPQKSRTNAAKHDCTFYEAASVFGDPLALDRPDPDHSADEERYILVGETDKGRLVVICYTERDDRPRIFSTRGPTRRERKDYEDGGRR